MVDYAPGFGGEEIRKGDTVVYPGRQGSSLWMTMAQVVNVGFQPTWRGGYRYLDVVPLQSNGYRTGKRKRRLTVIENVVKVS